MNMTIKIVVAIVVAVLLVIVGLRARKLRRDERRERFQRIDHRLLTPPPSPYTSSKGFRLLDGAVEDTARPEPPRPRLEPSKEYVFSESQLPPLDEVALSQARHDAKWALSRSARRSRGPVSGVGIALVLALIVVVGAVGYFTQRHHATTTIPSVASTTSTTAASTSTTVAWPSSFSPSAVSGTTATYTVPAQKYEVTVRGVAGAVWAVYKMGPKNTLEYQGSVGRGKSKTLQMTGASQITLGSPRNAAVSVGGSPVVFPSPLPAPLTLLFTPSSG
jgi:hypothetical protein